MRENRCATMTTADLLDELARRLAEATAWIPAGERSPGRDGVYLAWGVDARGEPWWDRAEYRDGAWRDDYDRPDGSVTHWRPLPSPPGEGE